MDIKVSPTTEISMNYTLISMGVFYGCFMGSTATSLIYDYYNEYKDKGLSRRSKAQITGVVIGGLATVVAMVGFPKYKKSI